MGRELVGVPQLKSLSGLACGKIMANRQHGQLIRYAKFPLKNNVSRIVVGMLVHMPFIHKE